MTDLLRQIVEFLQNRLPDLIRSGKSWQIRIHGKGTSVQMQVTEFVNFSDGSED